MSERKPRVSFSAYEVEEVEFKGHYFEIVPMTEERLVLLGELEDERLAAIEAAQDETEPGAEQTSEERREILVKNIGEAVEVIARILDIRTSPSSGGKKTLGERIRAEWKAGTVGFDQLVRFSSDIGEIDPFGASATPND